MAKYSLEIKQSAQKELNALDDLLFTRIDGKILALADKSAPQNDPDRAWAAAPVKVKIGGARDTRQTVSAEHGSRRFSS
ncbi:MAG: hypothetical protein LAP87_25030 [Acidobacteriia bacterium]|nr:hypothetical protein [Terriglobia bacterium]